MHNLPGNDDMSIWSLKNSAAKKTGSMKNYDVGMPETCTNYKKIQRAYSS